MPIRVVWRRIHNKVQSFRFLTSTRTNFKIYKTAFNNCIPNEIFILSSQKEKPKNWKYSFILISAVKPTLIMKLSMQLLTTNWTFWSPSAFPSQQQNMLFLLTRFVTLHYEILFLQRKMLYIGFVGCWYIIYNLPVY